VESLGRSCALSSPRDVPSRQEGLSVHLHLSNALWVQRDEAILDDYLDVLASNYDSALHQLDFINEPERSRVTINRWVRDETERRIEELIQQRGRSSSSVE